MIPASAFSKLLATLGLVLSLSGGMASGASAQDRDLVLYGAGSLRESMAEIADLFSAGHKIPVKTQFGASGRMRERIEAGEAVDVFTSADIGHPRKLVADGRATTMAMFARNTLCLLVPERMGNLQSADALGTLLKEDVKVGVSPPKIDPLGDYTVRLIDVAEQLRPGARASIEKRTTILDNPPGAPAAKSGDYVLDALNAGRVDLAVVYCSGQRRYAKLSKAVRMVAFPAELEVGPEYGLAVVSNTPQAMQLALAILSPQGQAVLASYGFKPVGLPQPAKP